MTARERVCSELILAVRALLREQCFWAYPPPMVDEGEGSLELYRRYKYGGKGKESRRWFRDRARRLAAKHMVRLYLFVRERQANDGTISQGSLDVQEENTAIRWASTAKEGQHAAAFPS